MGPPLHRSRFGYRCRNRYRYRKGRLQALILLLLTPILFPLPASADLDDCCGQEEERLCPPWTFDFWTNGFMRACDRGLRPEGGRCVNDTRRLIGTGWAPEALRFQRELAADEPVNEVTILDAHNAFNSTADGYILPNQLFSLTDQLRMGLRGLSLDIHWVNRAIRLCHAESDHKLCSPFDRLYTHGIREIDRWLRLPENIGEIILIDFEDRSDGHDAEVLEPIVEVLGDLVFRPQDKPADRWPTLKEMRALGRRVILKSNDTHGGEWIFGSIGSPGYPRSKVYHFDANWPDCTYTDDGGVTRSLDRSRFTVFYEARLDLGLDTGLVDPVTMRELADCNVTRISVDRIRPGRLRAAVWSWDVLRPLGVGDCAHTRTGDGRWVDADCAEAHAYACVNPDDPLDWVVTEGRGPWEEGDAVCEAEAPGFVLGLPVNGFQNRMLTGEIADTAWIDLTVESGSWGRDPSTHE